MNAAISDGMALLDDYNEFSSFFLASPRYTLLAQGKLSHLKTEGGPGQWRNLSKKVRNLFASYAHMAPLHDVMVGAIPFGEHMPAYLILPECVSWGKPLDGFPARSRPPQLIEVSDRQYLPALERYSQAVLEATTRISRGELSKIVLARSEVMTAIHDIDVHALLRQLVCSNAGAYTFAIDVGEDDHPAGAGRRTLIGASPELLVSRRGLNVLANPLAGSVPRRADPAEDQAAGQALLRSDKDRREHAFVRDAVAEALMQFCSKVHMTPEPALLRTDRMWHLSTEIRGRLRSSVTCVMELAMALHPTPAICGTPTETALRAILEIEGIERDYFAGMLGWINSVGDGEWIVTLRCADIQNRHIRLFAGAGIVEGSDPDAELAETSAKMLTVLSAMGLAS